MTETWINTIVGIIGIIVTIFGTLIAIMTIIKKKIITIEEKTNVYSSSSHDGIFTFDYSNNNGEYIIGEGEKSFNTKWSKADNNSIHAYNDGNGIVAIALLRNVKDIKNITNIEGDFSSRSRTPPIGDGIIWKNEAGNYAITKIISIKDDTRGDDHDELTCEYTILK